MSPNLFVLHGSQGLDPAHPDASGGRAMVLFGPDGVLLVDTQNRQVAEKTLKAIRSFTEGPIKVSCQHARLHRRYRCQNVFFSRQAHSFIPRKTCGWKCCHPPSCANGEPAPAPDLHRHSRRHLRVRCGDVGPPRGYVPPERRNSGLHSNDAVAHSRLHHRAFPDRPNVIYIEGFHRNFGYPFADQVNGGSIAGMLDAVDLIEILRRPRHDACPGPRHAGEKGRSARLPRDACRCARRRRRRCAIRASR